MCQVLREAKLRLAPIGSEMSVAEKEGWMARTMAFLDNEKKCADGAPSAKARVAQFEAKKPRLATHDFLCCLHSSIKASGNGDGFLKFAPPSGEPMRPWDDEVKPDEDVEAMCVGVMYEEQKQWVAIHYMKYRFACGHRVFPRQASQKE